MPKNTKDPDPKGSTISFPVFLNSLLAMLNGRQSLKRRFNGLSQRSPLYFSGASSKPAEFVHSFTSKETYPMESPISVSQACHRRKPGCRTADRSTQAMMISVSTEVETQHHEGVWQMFLPPTLILNRRNRSLLVYHHLGPKLGTVFVIIVTQVRIGALTAKTFLWNATLFIALDGSFFPAVSRIQKAERLPPVIAVAIPKRHASLPIARY